MGLPFGIGQFLAAAVLYRTLERDHDGTLDPTPRSRPAGSPTRAWSGSSTRRPGWAS